MVIVIGGGFYFFKCKIMCLIWLLVRVVLVFLRVEGLLKGFICMWC